MSLAQKHTKSWGTYLAINGKRDLKGRCMTEQQRLDVNPWHPEWLDKGRDLAGRIRQRIGDDLYLQFLEILPEETDDWSHQKFALAFERALAAIEDAGVLAQPGPVDLAVAALAAPISIHPYGRAKLERPCPECGAGVTPHLIDPDGYLIRCEACDFVGHLQDQAAIDRWEIHIEDIKSRFFSHLV